jgi:uncharacterized membrane protein
VSRLRSGEAALRIAIAVVALAGLGVSAYLTALRYADQDPSCVIGSGCTTVQDSEYAEIAGIPVAVLGLVAYAGLLLAALLPGPPGRALGLFTAIVGVGFSAWLTYAELFLIEAICFWCVISAILMVVALLLTAARAFRGAPGAEGSVRRSGPAPSPRAPRPRSSR